MFRKFLLTFKFNSEIEEVIIYRLRAKGNGGEGSDTMPYPVDLSV